MTFKYIIKRQRKNSHSENLLGKDLITFLDSFLLKIFSAVYDYYNDRLKLQLIEVLNLNLTLIGLMYDNLSSNKSETEKLLNEFESSTTEIKSKYIRFIKGNNGLFEILHTINNNYMRIKKSYRQHRLVNNNIIGYLDLLYENNFLIYLLLKKEHFTDKEIKSLSEKLFQKKKEKI